MGSPLSVQKLYTLLCMLLFVLAAEVQFSNALSFMFRDGICEWW